MLAERSSLDVGRHWSGSQTPTCRTDRHIYSRRRSHPWSIPDGAFDEGVALDIMLPVIQVVLTRVSIILLRLTIAGPVMRALTLGSTQTGHP